MAELGAGGAARSVPVPAVAAPGGRAAGIACFLGALVAFASYDAFCKQMLAHYTPPFMNLARYVAISVMAIGLLARSGDWRRWRGAHLRLLLIRSLMLGIVATCFMTALVTMPLAEATAIYFTAPLIMVALSPWLLGEDVGWAQWGAVAAGFAGMLLIVRPGGALPWMGTLLMGISAVCYAFFQLLTRRLSGLVPFSIQFAAMALVCLVVTSLPLLAHPQPLPAGRDWLLPLVGGVVSGVAQLLLLAAFRRVAASTLAPLNYVQLLLAVVISTLWFQRPPDSLALAGIALIVAAGVYLARWRGPMQERR